MGFISGEFIWDFVDMIPRRQSDLMIDMGYGSEWALGLHRAYVSWSLEDELNQHI